MERHAVLDTAGHVQVFGLGEKAARHALVGEMNGQQGGVAYQAPQLLQSAVKLWSAHERLDDPVDGKRQERPFLY